MGQRPQRDTGDRHFGQRLKEIRKSRGLTQAELGASVGLPQSMIAQYEGGYIRLHAGLIMRLSASLKAAPDDLLGSAPLKEGGGLQQRALLRRFKQIEKVPAIDRKALVRFLDALLARHDLMPERTARGRRTLTKAAKRSRPR